MLLLLLFGCYVQVAKSEVEQIKEIDLCLGTNEKKDIVEHLEKYLEDGQKQEMDDVFQNKEYGDFGNVTYTDKIRAVIKVQDGCDRFCSYCLIPYARGRIRSREPQNVINEIKSIAKKGIKEVIITGIHVASYGKDLENNYKLINLLEEINDIQGIERIRLGSIEPLLIDDEFLNRITKLNKICHHFHLSLQSGCNETLKRMNRRYSLQQFENIVKNLRKVYKDVILTTDIIVGFPGETENEFEETYNFLEKIKFYKMHVFKYSRRTGTKASVMENQIPNHIKEIRSKKIIELSNKNQSFYHSQYIGKTVNVLVEEKEKDYYKGHTSNYLLVKFKSNEDVINKMVRANIETYTDNELVSNSVTKS